MSQEAYLIPQGDPVSGPDIEDLKQWLAENAGKTPSDSPLAQGHSSYLAKDGSFYRTTSETSKHIGRHARLLQGEIKAFENAANVKTGKYLDVLLAASGAGIGGGVIRSSGQTSGSRSFKKFRRMFGDDASFKETRKRVESGVPLGFKNTEDVTFAIAPTRESLNKLGLTPDKAQIGVLGSSVTGRKYDKNTGKCTGPVFGKRDDSPDSDHDYFIVSPQLFNKAKKLGISIKGRGTYTDPMNKKQMKALGITLSTKHEYSRSIVIYRDRKVLWDRGPHILLEKDE